MPAHTGCELEGELDQMTLIEAGTAALCSKIKPVLRDCPACELLVGALALVDGVDEEDDDAPGEAEDEEGEEEEET